MTHFPKAAFPALCLASLTAAWPAMLCADSGQPKIKTELRAKAEAVRPRSPEACSRNRSGLADDRARFIRSRPRRVKALSGCC